MNAQNAPLFLPLVQALAEGKEIEVYADSKWWDCKNPSFDCSPEQYRIKAEPVEYEVWKAESGNLYRVRPNDGDSFARYGEYKRIWIRELGSEQPVAEPESSTVQPVAESEFDWGAFWRDAPEWCNWTAVDKVGVWYYYENEPVLNYYFWAIPAEIGGRWRAFESYTPPTPTDWTQSLVKRPVKEPEFDWSTFWENAPDWCNWVSMDRSGTWWFYRDEPFIRVVTWGTDNTSEPVYGDAPPACFDWKRSLIKNPNK